MTQYKLKSNSWSLISFWISVLTFLAQDHHESNFFFIDQHLSTRTLLQEGIDIGK
jgi:hypothetical protein